MVNIRLTDNNKRMSWGAPSNIIHIIINSSFKLCKIFMNFYVVCERGYFIKMKSFLMKEDQGTMWIFYQNEVALDVRRSGNHVDILSK